MNPQQMQDPLAQLRDIHMPNAVEQWPPAIGWWILAVVTLAALGTAIYWAIKYWEYNRYRKAACQAANSALSHHQVNPDVSRYLQTLSQIMRRAALTRHKQSAVAGLTGHNWLEFLDRSMSSTEFRHGPGKALADAPYTKPSELENVDVKAIHSLCQQWLKKHKVQPALKR